MKKTKKQLAKMTNQKKRFGQQFDAAINKLIKDPDNGLVTFIVTLVTMDLKVAGDFSTRYNEQTILDKEKIMLKLEEEFTEESFMDKKEELTELLGEKHGKYDENDIALNIVGIYVHYAIAQGKIMENNSENRKESLIDY